MIVACLRHGRTEWNDLGRMQGRADVPLSEAGREQVRRWRLPKALAGARFVASPLMRARETAALLGAPDCAIETALIEMDWGAWEGQTRAGLQALHGAAYEANAARGADFRPPGGESPRDVQRRVAAWLVQARAQPGPLVAVTHRGVIDALLALATGWDMRGKSPVRLADDVVHFLDVAEGGAVRARAWNVALVPGPLARRAPIARLEK
jgi:probable phosphoglycerate mutase